MLFTAHNALYPQYADRNLGDVCKIDWDKVEDFDLLTYSRFSFVDQLAIRRVGKR